MALEEQPDTDISAEVTVGENSKVTLPADVLAAANLKAGDHLFVSVTKGGDIRLRRCNHPKAELLAQLIGSSPGIVEASRLEELRNEWER